MHKLRETMSDQLGDSLVENISDSVLKTVEVMFGRKMFTVQEAAWEAALAPVAVNVALKQGTEQALLCLVFDRSLLSLLIAGVYPPESLSDDALLKDAAAEIVNVVCNKIKLFLNNHGYEITVGFPEAVDLRKINDQDDRIVNLKFSLFNSVVLSDNRILHVNLT